MKPPAITVAIPTCNGAEHLRATLRSIKQGPTAHDLLIVDDQSDDETLAIVRDEMGDQARIVVNPERLGLAGNWNRCVDLSQSPLVAIFHQDDLMFPRHLQTHLQAYQTDPSLGWVASHVTTIDGQGIAVPPDVVDPGGLGDADRDFPREVAVASLATHNPLRCSAVTINASAHREVGGFDPSCRYIVDWDYWLRVAAVRPVAWRAEATVAVRWHLGSETHRFATGSADLDETAHLLDRIAPLIGGGSANPAGWRRSADRRLARAYLNRAYVASKHGDAHLALRALARSLRLAPMAIVANLALDPRLLARLAASIMLPRQRYDRTE